MQRKLCEIFGPDEDSNSQNSSISSNSSNSNFQFTIQRDSLSPTRKVMKIQYQDYYNRILTSEMKSLMHQSYLNDVQFVCKDGNVSANCLIIGNFAGQFRYLICSIFLIYSQLPGRLFSLSHVSKKLSHHFLFHFSIGVSSYDHHAKYGSSTYKTLFS